MSTSVDLRQIKSSNLLSSSYAFDLIGPFSNRSPHAIFDLSSTHHGLDASAAGTKGIGRRRLSHVNAPRGLALFFRYFAHGVHMVGRCSGRSHSTTFPSRQHEPFEDGKGVGKSALLHPTLTTFVGRCTVFQVPVLVAESHVSCLMGDSTLHHSNSIIALTTCVVAHVLDEVVGFWLLDKAFLALVLMR